MLLYTQAKKVHSIGGNYLQQKRALVTIWGKKTEKTFWGHGLEDWKQTKIKKNKTETLSDKMHCLTQQRRDHWEAEAYSNQSNLITQQLWQGRDQRLKLLLFWQEPTSSPLALPRVTRSSWGLGRTVILPSPPPPVWSSPHCFSLQSTSLADWMPKPPYVIGISISLQELKVQRVQEICWRKDIQLIRGRVVIQTNLLDPGQAVFTALYSWKSNLGVFCQRSGAFVLAYWWFQLGLPFGKTRTSWKQVFKLVFKRIVSHICFFPFQSHSPPWPYPRQYCL